MAPLRQGIVDQIASGGKRLRAALAVLACELFGEPPATALDFAAAIEHLQNASLIHDDIADGDRQRRNQIATWAKHGIGHAVNIGDGFLPLVTLAIVEAPYAEAVKLQLFRLLAECGLEMVEGQALDLSFRAKRGVSLEEYFDCTAKKTGALLSLATIGGAVIGGGGDEHLMLLREFARLAGVAFQIRDDLLDIEGTKGRQPGSDVLEGKLTILAVHAGLNANPRQRARLFAILAKPRAVKSSADLPGPSICIGILGRRRTRAALATRSSRRRRSTSIACRTARQSTDYSDSAATSDLDAVNHRIHRRPVRSDQHSGRRPL